MRSDLILIIIVVLISLPRILAHEYPLYYACVGFFLGGFCFISKSRLGNRHLLYAFLWLIVLDFLCFVAKYRRD